MISNTLWVFATLQCFAKNVKEQEVEKTEQQEEEEDEETHGGAAEKRKRVCTNHTLGTNSQSH